MPHTATATAIDNIVTYFETITPETVSRVNELYTPDAYFKDPFKIGRAHV